MSSLGLASEFLSRDYQSIFSVTAGSVTGQIEIGAIYSGQPPAETLFNHPEKGQIFRTEEGQRIPVVFGATGSPIRWI